MIYPLKEMTQLWELRNRILRELAEHHFQIKHTIYADEVMELIQKIQSISPNKPKEIDNE